jgi:hypothetical protein
MNRTQRRSTEAALPAIRRIPRSFEPRSFKNVPVKTHRPCYGSQLAPSGQGTLPDLGLPETRIGDNALVDALKDRWTELRLPEIVLRIE